MVEEGMFLGIHTYLSLGILKLFFNTDFFLNRDWEKLLSDSYMFSWNDTGTQMHYFMWLSVSLISGVLCKCSNLCRWFLALLVFILNRSLGSFFNTHCLTIHHNLAPNHFGIVDQIYLCGAFAEVSRVSKG